MTNADVLNFVEMEIAKRYRTLDDTVRGDWARAVWKAGEIEKAREIIRAIVDDPDASLNVKTFYRQLRSRKAAAAGPRMPAQPTAYDPYILCLEPPSGQPAWKSLEWFVMGSPAKNPIRCFSRSNAADKQYVSDWAGLAAKAFAAEYGGQWCGVVREVNNEPYDGQLSQQQNSEEAARRSLNGPDTPARRRLVQMRNPATLLPELKIVPPEPERKMAASREMIDRMRKPLERTGQPLQADEDWFNEESEKLRAEELTYVPPQDEMLF